MPSYLELAAEDCYVDEATPPNISVLAGGLRAFYPGVQIGTKGDNRHLNGYHRSRRWIKESVYCTNSTYSVSRTSGDRGGGDSNWVCALDIGGLPADVFHGMCKRIDEAVRSGQFEKITEWYGSFGDDDIVDGFDNIANRLATSDRSHLFHAHLSFDRGRANEDHADVLSVLIGDDDSMFCSYGQSGQKVKAMQLQLLTLDPNSLPRFGADGGYGDETATALSRLVTGGPGRDYNADAWVLMQKLFAAKVAGKGDKGDPGPPGPKGDQGEPGKTPTIVSFGPVDALVTGYAV